MVVTALSEPSSSATQAQCLADAWRNASPFSRSGCLVPDGRSTRDLHDSDKDGLVNLGTRAETLENGCLFAGRYCHLVSVLYPVRRSLKQVPDPTGDT